jgi:hypothetical protein
MCLLVGRARGSGGHADAEARFGSTTVPLQVEIREERTTSSFASRSDDAVMSSKVSDLEHGKAKDWM